MRSAIVAVLLASTALAEDAKSLIQDARAALRKGDAVAAEKAADAAVKLDAKSTAAVFLRGEARAAQRKSESAIKDFDAALALDKTFLIAVDRRGGERFKLGQIDESIADFDEFIKAHPAEGPAHWRRGISLYYAGRFPEGAKQFFDGQEKYGADVENVFWHYLCNARKDGVPAARKAMIELKGPDARVPMMQVAELIKGKMKASEVIATAEKAKLESDEKNEAVFYANLYVGLNYEAEGDKEKCLEHLTMAVEKHKIGHYMWDVGNTHLRLLKKK